MVNLRSSRIPMTSLTALTLHSSRQTTSRRGPPIPQLTCQGKTCRQFQPSVVQCIKVGEDGVGGLEWKCEAELPRGVKFGEIEVGCEGWDSPDDPYILKGSCGLTYTLIRSSPSLEANFSLSPSRTTLLSSSTIFNLLFTSIFLYLLLKFLASLSIFSNIRRFFPHTPNGPRFNPGGGPGGGPGFNGGQPPPPPYSAKPSTEETRGDRQQGWRPGFWSGLAAGAVGNHLLRPAGTNANTRENGFGFGGARGGWGGGNLREWERRDDQEDRGIGGSGGGMARSTGFGGTRNR